MIFVKFDKKKIRPKNVNLTLNCRKGTRNRPILKVLMHSVPVSVSFRDCIVG